MWSIQHLCAIVRARIEIVLCNSPHWNPDHCGCYPLTALRTQVAVTITAALPDMIGGMLFLSVLCRAIVGLSIIQYHIWMHARLRWQSEHRKSAPPLVSLWALWHLSIGLVLRVLHEIWLSERLCWCFIPDSRYLITKGFQPACFFALFQHTLLLLLVLLSLSLSNCLGMIRLLHLFDHCSLCLYAESL
jgi:hypothetical protein